jgi:glycosyltransferase involved in cell wall biosynthesis
VPQLRFRSDHVSLNSQPPAVGVIIPCYNVEPCLERALNSVRAQTFRDYCIHAVDDGSTDRTAEILQHYPDCHVLPLGNRLGAAAARNHAIRISKAPFIAFLDADDEWLPQKLTRQMALLEESPDLGLVCSCCQPGESRREQIPADSAPLSPLTGRLFRRLVRDCFVFTPTVIIRRECLQDIGLFNESLTVSEDFNLWLRIAARWKIALLPEVLAIRHRRPESLSFSSDPDLMQRQGIAALEHVESNCPGLTLEEQRALHAALAERNYCYGSYLLSTGATSAARRRFAEALRLNPSHWRAFAKRSFSFLPAGAFRSFTQLKTRHGFRTKPADSAQA